MVDAISRSLARLSVSAACRTLAGSFLCRAFSNASSFSPASSANAASQRVRNRAAGVAVEGEEYPEMVHDWMMLHAFTLEAERAYQSIGRFVRRVTRQAR